MARNHTVNAALPSNQRPSLSLRSTKKIDEEE